MRRPTDLLLLFGCAAGLGSIAWMLLAPAGPLDDAVDQTAQITLPALEAPPPIIEILQVYDPIIERPLFSADRTAVVDETLVDESPTEVIAAEPAARIDGFRLTAVFSGAETRTALVELPTGDALTVREGDRLQNWQVLEIQEAQLVLSYRDQRQTLMVHDFAYLGEPRVVPRTRALTERALRAAERRQSRKNRTQASLPRQRRAEQPEEID